MSYECCCKILTKSNKRFKSYSRFIFRSHFFAVKSKCPVLICGAVLRKRYGVLRRKLVGMLIGMFCGIGVNFAKIYTAVQKLCTFYCFCSYFFVSPQSKQNGAHKMFQKVGFVFILFLSRGSPLWILWRIAYDSKICIKYFT